MKPEAECRAICGLLAADSPLLDVFPTRRVPLAGPSTAMVRLGQASDAQRVYMLDVKSCTELELTGIAKLMATMGQGTAVEAYEELKKGEPMPIRERNISGVTFPLRCFV